MMNVHEFSSLIKESFESYFRKLYLSIKRGDLEIKVPYSYPTSLRIAESPHHFIAELMGTTLISNVDKFYLDLLRTPEKINNTSIFFNPGGKINNSMIPVLNVSNARFFSLINLTIITDYDKEIFLEKINFPLTASEIEYKNADMLLKIEKGCKACYFRNLKLIRTDKYRVFFRNVATAIIINKNVNREDIINFLNYLIELAFKGRYLFGINLGISKPKLQFAEDLLSLTDQDVKESVLDKYIQKHLRFFVEALGYQYGLSQPKLKWIERELNDPKESIPDYLLLRSDGFYDILDLKRSILNYSSIVRGGRRRPRFIAYVTELIGQLDTYKRYFEKKMNNKWAFNKYGIKIKNPKLIGIVGNYDNFQLEEVELAKRPYNKDIIILSYADIINLLRERK